MHRSFLGLGGLWAVGDLDLCPRAWSALYSPSLWWGLGSWSLETLIRLWRKRRQQEPLGLHPEEERQTDRHISLRKAPSSKPKDLRYEHLGAMPCVPQP